MKYSDGVVRAMIHAWLVEENTYNEPKPSKCNLYQDLAGSCHYSVIEDYAPDVMPGWRGDILTVVWGAEDIFDLFYIEDGSLTRIEPDGH
jgi:hypothetical protein